MKTTDITIDHNDTTLFLNPVIENHGFIAGIRQTIKLWKQRSQGRRALRHLSLHHLQDIGIIQDEAASESDKPFWRK
jgi:uncharacterized protein YjiS (DUF1127 family)